MIMKQGTVYKAQLLITRNLPFWTTTYYFYINERKKAGIKVEQNIISGDTIKVKEKTLDKAVSMNKSKDRKK